MALSMQAPEILAHEVSQETKAHEAGVVVTVSRSLRETLYSIWSIGPDGQINGHELNAHTTDKERLLAHVKGFVENHLRAWA